MSIWYYVEGGERRGPVDQDTLAAQLRSGSLPAATLVWRDGMGDWVPATEVAELTRGGGGMSAAAPMNVDVGVPLGAGYDPYAQQHHGEVHYVTYAGFWKRFVAWFIDSIITGVAGGCLQIGIVAVVAGSLTAAGGDVEEPAINMVLQIGTTIIGIALAWLYFALFESSQYQATPGKMAIQIKVTDLEGNRISFLRATGRHFAKILSGLILLIGYIMAGFTEKKQALHDMLAATLVVNK